MNLRRLINLERGETTLVMLMMLYSAAIGIAINYYFTASSALFLSKFEIATLPYTFLAAGVAQYLTRFVYARLEARLSPAHLQIVSLVFLMGMLAAIRFGLAIIESAWLLFAIMVLFRVMILLLVIGFWGMANGLFTLSQSKRLFPVISAGDVISIMIGSFLLPVIVPVIGTENLFLLVLLSIGVCLLCAVVIQRRYLASKGQGAAAKPGAAPKFNPLRNRYILFIFGLFILAWTLNYALDYAFLGQLQIRYAADPTQIASFIGVLFGLIQTTNFFLKFFISGRLISRYGLRFGLFIEPVVITAGIALAFAVGILNGVGALFFWVMIVTKYGEEVLREAFNESSTRILYQPLPAHQRASALALVEGNGFPVAALVAGGVFVFFSITNLYTPLLITSLMLILGVLWVVMAVKTYRQFTHTLRKALEKRTFSGANFFTRDAETFQLLTAKLRSNRADEVIYALNLLENFDLEQVRRLLPTLLRSPLIDVRLHVLERLEAGNGVASPDLILDAAQYDASLLVREAALRTYGVLVPEEAANKLKPHLTNQHVGIKRGALTGMLRSRAPEAAALAQNELQRLTNSADPVDRQTAGQVIGAAGSADMTPLLLSLLQDDSLVVRQSALIASGKVADARALPFLIAALSDRSMRRNARLALMRCGALFLDEVRRRLEGETDRAVLLQLTRICSRMRDPAVIDTMQPYIGWSQRDIRSEILGALALNGYQANDKAVIERQIHVECTEVLWLRSAFAKIERNTDDPLIVSALREEIKAGQRRVLMLLSFIYERSTIFNVQNALNSNSPTQQSYALEMLDVLLPQHLKHEIRSLFEGTPSEPRDSFEALLKALADDDCHLPWLRTAACYALHSFNPCEDTMLSIIEKVLLLRNAAIFSGIPDPILAELATIVEEMDFSAGDVIFSKGDAGSSMFIIAHGKVRVHDGDVIFNTLEESAVFGEMAVLASEPRTATVTALEDTLLFSVDQSPFFDIMGEYPEISQGIIRVLIGHLRDRMQDITALTADAQKYGRRS